MSRTAERAESDPARQEEGPFAIVRGVVEDVEPLSPSFVRITFAGPELRAIGTPGSTWDQRIKLIFPPESGELPVFDREGEDWYGNWLAVPDGERGSMRTYSIRDLDVSEQKTSLVVDFVLHLVPGETGPASNWAGAARAGDELLIVAPRRGRLDGGGIEYRPGEAGLVLLAGDETAAPAIARILEDSGPETRGVAFIEVPERGDRLRIDAPDGVEVRWLSREGSDTGSALIPSVLEHLETVRAAEGGAGEVLEIRDIDSEDLLWETPDYSGLGEPIAGAENRSGAYFWIAGESGTVTTLRRRLVRDFGIDRAQVAFMGYWRRGVAMKG